MATLKNITLSNIRRFGKDVSIPISPQASIILAPNGTGKTSLFEAIEFAITGKVERLENEMIALIKDTHDFADVCLDFGDFQAFRLQHKSKSPTTSCPTTHVKELLYSANQPNAIGIRFSLFKLVVAGGRDIEQLTKHFDRFMLPQLVN